MDEHEKQFRYAFSIENGEMVADLSFGGATRRLVGADLDHWVEVWREFVGQYDAAAEQLDMAQRNDL